MMLKKDKKIGYLPRTSNMGLKKDKKIGDLSRNGGMGEAKKRQKNWVFASN